MGREGGGWRWVRGSEVGRGGGGVWITEGEEERDVEEFQGSQMNKWTGGEALRCVVS